MSIMDAATARDNEPPLIEHLQSVAASRLVSSGRVRRKLRRELAELSAHDEEIIIFGAKADLSGRRISELSGIARPKVDKVIADAKANGTLPADPMDGDTTAATEA